MEDRKSIEVTPEMIEAGQRVLMYFFPDGDGIEGIDEREAMIVSSEILRLAMEVRPAELLEPDGDTLLPGANKPQPRD